MKRAAPTKVTAPVAKKQKLLSFAPLSKTGGTVIGGTVTTVSKENGSLSTNSTESTEKRPTGVTTIETNGVSGSKLENGKTTDVSLTKSVESVDDSKSIDSSQGGENITIKTENNKVIKPKTQVEAKTQCAKDIQDIIINIVSPAILSQIVQCLILSACTICRKRGKLANTLTCDSEKCKSKILEDIPGLIIDSHGKTWMGRYVPFVRDKMAPFPPKKLAACYKKLSNQLHGPFLKSIIARTCLSHGKEAHCRVITEHGKLSCGANACRQYSKYVPDQLALMINGALKKIDRDIAVLFPQKGDIRAREISSSHHGIGKKVQQKKRSSPNRSTHETSSRVSKEVEHMHKQFSSLLHAKKNTRKTTEAILMDKLNAANDEIIALKEVLDMHKKQSESWKQSHDSVKLLLDKERRTVSLLKKTIASNESTIQKLEREKAANKKAIKEAKKQAKLEETETNNEAPMPSYTWL